jgi:drug/metabolite transporter, DME family
MESARKYGIIATVLAAILWSTGGLFIKILPQSAFTILFYRSLYAGLLFLIVFKGKALKINKLSFAASVFYAILLITFVNATKLTTAANAIFLQYTAPAFVLLLEPRIFKIQLKPINVVTVILSFFGMALFFIDQLETDNWLGIGIACISGLGLTGFVLCQRLNSAGNQANSILMGNLWIILITVPIVHNDLSATLIEHSILLFLGIVQIGMGYMLFTYGQRVLPAIESSLIAILEPILNPIWVLIGYGEVPSRWAIIGGSIIIFALIFRLLYLEWTKKLSGSKLAV